MSKQLSNHIDNKLNQLLESTGDMALKRRAFGILKELDIKPGDKILEVGCGDGYYLHLLSSLGIKIYLTGIDIDKRALDSARANLKGKRVKLKQVDIMKGIPFPSRNFDKVIMSEVAEHLPDDLKGLKEVYRILKKNGVLILTVPNSNYPFLWDPINFTLEHFFNYHIKSGFWAGLWNQHIRLYKPKKINNVIKKAGFKVEKIKPLTWWCLPFNHYILNFGARILAVNRKNALMKGSDKFSPASEKSLISKIFFNTVQNVDKLNDFYMPSDAGVSVFVKAVK
jgi:SAM-dependent methyltransferase